MSHTLVQSPLLPILFLVGSLFLTICSSATLHLGKYRSKELLKPQKAPLFFFRHILKKLTRTGEWENLHFCISLSKHIYELGYAITGFFFLISSLPALHQLVDRIPSQDDWGLLFFAGGSLIVFSLFLDFLARLFAHIWSRPLLKLAAPFASFYLILLFPIVGPLLKLIRLLVKKAPLSEEGEVLADKTKIREMISESELQQHLDPTDQKLITSFLGFKERVAREIMVPRVDMFCLPADLSIKQAAEKFAQENYSRIPVYENSLDRIIGVALYKDLIKCFTGEASNLNASLKTIVKPVLYSPENKKIAQLLQEFKAKQIHMAIIVDEYGGTEGIVTIEDILEQLVGEIEDESDIGEDSEFAEIPGSGWIVDAKMTLIDIENQLGIKIPQSPEYETLGGYVFHCAGTIPSKGWKISHDEFDLEVLSSNERSLKKIKITPRIK
jgi:putative hemolysin